MSTNELGRSTLVLRSVMRLRTRYLMLFALIAVSTAIAVVGVALGSYAGDASSSSAQETRRLREITVYAGGRPIAEDELTAFRATEGVTHAVPFVRVVVGLPASEGATVSLIGVDEAARPPSLLQGAFGSDAEPDWIVLPQRAGDQELGPLLGSDITVTATSSLDSETGTTKDFLFRVVGISDPGYQVDAVDAAYTSLTTAKALYFDRLGITPAGLVGAGGYEKATVVVGDQTMVPRVVDRLQAQGFQAVSVMQELDAVPGVIALIRLVTALVTAGLFVVCIITSVMFAVSLIRQRAREFGILRAVGWSAGRVQALWLGEMLLVSVAGAAVGFAAGLVGGNVLAAQVRGMVSGGSLGAPAVDLLAALGVVAVLLATSMLAVLATVALAARSDIATLMRGLS